MRSRDLRHNRLEPREDQRGHVELPGLIAAQDFIGDILGMDEGERAHGAQLNVLDDLLLGWIWHR